MGKLAYFTSLWESLVYFARLWTSQTAYRLRSVAGGPLCRTAGELLSDVRASDVLPELERTFQLVFRAVLGIIMDEPCYGLQFEYIPSRSPALVDAICAFIPPEVVSHIDNREYEKLSQILQQREATAISNATLLSTGASPLLSPHDRISHVGEWAVDQLHAFLPHFTRAHERLNAVKSDQLLRLATLYDAHPAFLKTPFAPQSPTPRPNTLHISLALRRDAELMRTQLMCTGTTKNRNHWYRFRYLHPALVPTDKALHMFAAHGESTFPYPKDLQTDAARVRDGFCRIYRPDGTLGQDVRCISEGSPGVTRHVLHRDTSRRAFPCPEAELQWLGSLMQCVQWISEQASSSSWSLPRPLLDPEDYHHYIASEPAQVIAEQLLADRQLSEVTRTCSSKMPSLTALYMPTYSSQRTREVAKCVWPDMDNGVRQLLWDEMLKKIKRGLARPPALPSHEDNQSLACDEAAHPSDDKSADPWEQSVQQYRASRIAATSDDWTQLKCYICCMRITQPHKTLRAMCHPCGDFNLAGSSLSLPQNLNLEGRTALVTGGRTNLGFHVALRLLRCGARVIVSTRYPRDAVTRYRAQPDLDAWEDRLRVVGADFRSARDAFELVAKAKAVVEQWGGTLDILINNAAQTLTDSLDTEKAAVRRENRLIREKDSMMVEGPPIYQPRIRGGMTANMALEGLALERAPTKRVPAITPDEFRCKESGSLATQMSQLEIGRASQLSSWMQSISDIPYEDIISAHSVNTFVPLILVRELLPIMNHKTRSQSQTSPSPSSSQQSSAAGYIINVSSREGIFEARADHQSKAGKHIHTNMSKAGLNMITETEASSAWKSYRVAMNTVDPGYMSAAPELEQSHGGERPLGWEDGAGRVLWPVAMGEKNNGGVLRGRFLKHYGAVRVDTRLGRG